MAAESRTAAAAVKPRGGLRLDKVSHELLGEPADRHLIAS